MKDLFYKIVGYSLTCIGAVIVVFACAALLISIIVGVSEFMLRLL